MVVTQVCLATHHQINSYSHYENTVPDTLFVMMIYNEREKNSVTDDCSGSIMTSRQQRTEGHIGELGFTDYELEVSAAPWSFS